MFILTNQLVCFNVPNANWNVIISFTEFLYYEFTNCCTQEVLSFNPGEDPFVIITPGTYLYTGPAYEGLLPNKIGNFSFLEAQHFIINSKNEIKNKTNGLFIKTNVNEKDYYDIWDQLLEIYL